MKHGLHLFGALSANGMDWQGPPAELQEGKVGPGILGGSPSRGNDGFVLIFLGRVINRGTAWSHWPVFTMGRKEAIVEWGG